MSVVYQCQCNAVIGTSSSAEYVVVMSNILVGVFSAGVYT